MPQSPDLNGGLPRPWIEPHDNKDALQTRYGNFAISVLAEMRANDPEFPMDILAMGDNWYQLSESRDWANTDIEAEMAPMGYEIFGDMWPIMSRDENESVRNVLGALVQGVRAGSLDDRIMDKVAVLDRTSVAYPAFDEEHIEKAEQRPWGRVIKIKGFPMMVYHITSGYSRKSAQDLDGTKPDDDMSATILWNE